MKIQQHDMYHGSALTQIVQHESFKALNKLDSKFGHYIVNSDIKILVKYRRNTRSPWLFNLYEYDIETINNDIQSGDEFFLCLICGDTTICAINSVQIRQLIDVNSETTQSIRAEVPSRGSIWLKGSNGVLRNCIPHNSFPDSVFS